MSGIRNLHSEETTYTILGEEYHGVRWSWQFEGDDDVFYETGKDGDGIWMYNVRKNDRKQIAGTCQFTACQTASGMRRKLEKYFSE